MSTERSCYCPTCGHDTPVPSDLGAGAMSLCPSCENVIEFPGGAAVFFDKVSELTMRTDELQQIRVMRAQLRQQKAGLH